MLARDTAALCVADYSDGHGDGESSCRGDDDVGDVDVVVDGEDEDEDDDDHGFGRLQAPRPRVAKVVNCQVSV